MIPWLNVIIFPKNQNYPFKCVEFGMEPDRMDLDRFDRAILSAVAGDGRISVTDLARRVAMPTVSREGAHGSDLQAYLDRELVPVFDQLGF